MKRKTKTASKKREPKKCDPDRAIAAAEVLEAVWLREDRFELEYKVDAPPIAEVDTDGYTWVTVKLHVPRLDIDMWSDGTHHDHPNNQEDEDES